MRVFKKTMSDILNSDMATDVFARQFGSVKEFDPYDACQTLKLISNLARAMPNGKNNIGLCNNCFTNRKLADESDFKKIS